MQRRNYETIAAIIAQLPTNTDGINDLRAFVAEAMAEGLRGSNPNYDKARFYTACTTGKMGKGRSHKNVTAA